MNLSYDFKKLLDIKIESGLLKNKQAKPLVLLLKKYGIEGMDAMNFIAELATVVQEMQQAKTGGKNDEEHNSRG